MSSFLIEGGHSLSGDIYPQGAKNEALQILCATLLTPERVVINNIPDILDIRNLIHLLREMGVKVERLSDESYAFQADNVSIDYTYSEEYAQKASSLRGSVLMLGPMLGRFGKAVLPQVGGDKIGRRRLDTHMVGFKALGAEFNHNIGRHTCEITASKLTGKYMLLDEASVTDRKSVV